MDENQPFFCLLNVISIQMIDFNPIGIISSPFKDLNDMQSNLQVHGVYVVPYRYF